METTRLSSKGQVILPKSIRTAHQWDSGVEFEVQDTFEGVLLRPIKPYKQTGLADVVGCVGYQGPARTIEEMDQAIEAAVKARHDRG